MTPEQDPRYAQAISYHQNGKVNEALPLYAALYARWPYHAHLLASYGTALAQTGELERGLALLDQALAYAPDLEFAQINRASALATLGRYNEALEAYCALPHTRGQQADLLVQLGRLDEALDAYDDAIDADSENAKHHHGKGLVLLKLGRKDEALASFEDATDLDPYHADAWCEQGKLHKDAKRLDEAVIAFNTALIANACHWTSVVGLCTTLLDLDRADEALDLINMALGQAPLKELYLNKAVILHRLHDYGAALACVDQAQALDPECPSVWAHRGYLLMASHRPAEARVCYEKALAKNPTGNDENWAYALLHLAEGDFLTGWRLYEWRWQREEGKHYLESWPRAPRWLGDWSIQGKTVLVLCEQGMGDTLQFCRLAPRLVELGATVKLHVQKALAPLLARSFPEVEVIANTEGVGGFDFFVPLLSLPLALKLTVNTIPCRPYLKAEPILIKRWLKRLGAKLRPRIGLAWSGNPNPKSDHKRTIPLADLAPILNRDADFYVLQKDVRETDDLTAFPNLRYLPEALDGFDQTAALAMCMDRIITIDTSIAHLTGALGLETWMLTPYHACWRWLLERDDSPWYPSLTLFRQPTPGAWGPVIERVAERLS